MKGFALDNSGDVIIKNNEIQMVYGNELVRQKVSSVLGTNKREWFFDWDLGIDFSVLLGKGVNGELVKYEIEKGLHQVDESFEISEFSTSVDKTQRKLTVTFKAKASNGAEVGGEYEYAY